VLKRGRVFMPFRGGLVRGASHACHRNATHHYVWGWGEPEICTGYRLSNPGV
jgi:hypothetical protein